MFNFRVKSLCFFGVKCENVSFEFSFISVPDCIRTFCPPASSVSRQAVGMTATAVANWDN